MEWKWIESVLAHSICWEREKPHICILQAKNLQIHGILNSVCKRLCIKIHYLFALLCSLFLQDLCNKYTPRRACLWSTITSANKGTEFFILCFIIIHAIQCVFLACVFFPLVFINWTVQQKIDHLAEIQSPYFISTLIFHIDFVLQFKANQVDKIFIENRWKSNEIVH